MTVDQKVAEAEKKALEALLSAALYYVNRGQIIYSSFDEKQRKEMVSIMQTAASALPREYGAVEFVSDILRNKLSYYEMQHIHRDFFETSWELLMVRTHGAEVIRKKYRYVRYVRIPTQLDLELEFA